MAVRTGREKRPGGLLLRADGVTADGQVLGVAYDPGASERCIVSVLIGGAPAGQAVADRFRRDLLDAGLAHGHAGFALRLRARLPAGPCRLTLSCAEKRVSVTLAVPAQGAACPETVEGLLTPPPGWTVDDFLSRPDCLPWARYHAKLGTAGFVDAAFRFALMRWPSDAEAGVHGRSLERGDVSPEGLIVSLLRSRERGDRAGLLMSPFDPGFRF